MTTEGQIIEYYQSPNSRTIDEIRDNLFNDVNLQDVPTGFLLEYGLYLEDPTKYISQNQTKNNSIYNWRLLYEGLRTCIANQKAIELPDLEKINQGLNELLKEDNVVLPIIYIDCNSFYKDLKTAHEVNSRLGSEVPEYTHTLFALAPSETSINGNAITFFFK